MTDTHESSTTVSIGLPVYNGALFLAAALDSILAQTHENLELTVSDNGSTDETEEICREYVRRDSRLRYLRRDVNRGAAWNYNSLVHETTGAGAYFKWASHDDVLAPTYLEKCLEVMRRVPNASVVYPRTRWIDENGDLGSEVSRDLELREPTPHERLAALAKNFSLGNASFGLIRRGLLERTHLLGAFPSADFVLLAELALQGEIHQLPESLFFRRNHPEMSRRANPTPKDVAEWFEPGSGRDDVRERWGIFVESMRAIKRAPLGRVERARCYAAFLEAWWPQNLIPVVEERFDVEYTGAWLPFRRTERPSGG
jgi:glycosyltransferase involved in cell wall biosynthesis